MAPTRTVKSKVTGPKGKGRSGTEGSLGSKNRISKLKPKGKPPPPKQQKTKAAQGPAKKKKRVYTDKELGIPKLNTITPVGVEKPKGKKKGKIFVDDRESMMTILAMVNADKEGQIESKMIKARHMEEIREARKKEAEARQAQKLSKLEETKDSIRKKRKRKNAAGDVVDVDGLSAPSPRIKADRKRVSFA